MPIVIIYQSPRLSAAGVAKLMGCGGSESVVAIDASSSW
jgi:hypothetical protein